MSEKKTIGNVNILDLRKTSEETIRGIEKVGNVNILLYSPETASFVSQISMGNVNVSIEAPQDVENRTVMGNLRLTPDSLDGDIDGKFHIVMGNVIVETGPADASLEKTISGLAGLAVMGNVYCPESLAPAVQSKIMTQMGNFIPYPDDATLITGTLDLSAGLLEGIDKPKGFVVTGSLRAIENVSAAVARKIEYLRVYGSIVCAEENADAIRSKLRGGKSRLTVVPSGYRYHDGDLELNAASLESMSGAKLFCSGMVVFAADVEPASIETGLEGVRSLGLIACPERLKDAIKSKLDLIEDRVIFYEGDLWLYDEEHTLHASRFEYSEGKATALVIGELRIEPDVSPATLADRFHVIHNLGEIRCTPEQMGAIEARLGIHEGELRDSTLKEKEHYDIGNANVLAL